MMQSDLPHAMTSFSPDDTAPGIARMLRSPRPAVLLALLTSLLLAAGTVLSTASSVAAHDSILSASPEADATVGVAPQEISLTFSGEILAVGSAVVIEVIAPGGQNLGIEQPQIDGTTVTQALTRDQEPGLYTVRWRVVSSDGHPISGEYAYTLVSAAIPDNPPTPEPTAAAQRPEPSPTRSTAGSADDGHSGQASSGAELFPVLAVISGVVIVGGTLVVVLMVARERRRRDRATAERAQAESSTSVKTDDS